MRPQSRLKSVKGAGEFHYMPSNEGRGAVIIGGLRHHVLYLFPRVLASRAIPSWETVFTRSGRSRPITAYAVHEKALQLSYVPVHLFHIRCVLFSAAGKKVVQH
eukprot:6212629-Pleurochrysis_carterae.AAC.1